MKKIVTIIALLFTAAIANAQCTAAFSYTNAGNVFSFTDLSTTSSGSVSTWIWTFGDLTAPSTQQNPQHTYDACGYYVVTLNIFTTSFCSSSFSDTILVNSGFSGSFTANVDTVTGTVNFQAQPNSPQLNYAWDFGDASTGTGANPAHTYATSGNYNVCLVIGDTGNICVDTICQNVNVYIAPPNCNASFTNTLTGVGAELFNATPFNFNWDYSWDFGDSSPLGNGFIANHTYTTTGTYTVCLTITDSSTSCTSTFCDTVNIVIPVTCPPSFTATGFNGTYVFTASPFNIQNTYSWDFGDGSPLGSNFVANHTYALSGTYTVCLTMTTSFGCTGTFCDTVNVVLSGIDDPYLVQSANLYPNPANETVQLEYTLALSSEIRYELMDLTGRVLLTNTVNRGSGTQRESISLSSLATGTYLVRLTSDNGSVNFILVKD